MEREMTTKHTPTPWQVTEGSQSAHCCFGNSIIGSDCSPVCETITSFSGQDELEKANAAFIVRAVNSHDTLVDALKNARIALSGPKSPLLERIDAALAQAKGE